MCSKPIIKLKRRQKMIELNKVTASIVVASTVLIAAIGILIYRDIKHERQIDNLTKQHNILQANLNNLTKQQNNLEANLNDRIIDISVITTSKLMEKQKNEDNEKLLKINRKCVDAFGVIDNFLKCIGIKMNKGGTIQEFYNANKEKLDNLRNLLGENSHTTKPSEHKIKKSVSGSKEETSEISKSKENALGTNGTKDNETAPKLNKKTK